MRWCRGERLEQNGVADDSSDIEESCKKKGKELV